ncbi:MAG: hypothetical protein EOP53_16760 [Sphingobacteriales bacterium]|nr:MAG: hypothetical protein EOP53_16760 [Sphingobacteriales bacterium]
MSEIKSTDATPQRPDGERVLDASITEIDINAFIEKIKSESTWKDSDRNSMTIHKSEQLVVVLIGLHEGAEMKPHKAGGILSLQVLHGKIDFIAEDKKTTMKKGNMLVLHENIFHNVIALEESFLLLSIAKVKEAG